MSRTFRSEKPPRIRPPSLTHPPALPPPKAVLFFSSFTLFPSVSFSTEDCWFYIGALWKSAASHCGCCVRESGPSGSSVQRARCVTMPLCLLMWASISSPPSVSRRCAPRVEPPPWLALWSILPIRLSLAPSISACVTCEGSSSASELLHSAHGTQDTRT